MFSPPPGCGEPTSLSAFIASVTRRIGLYLHPLDHERRWRISYLVTDNSVQLRTSLYRAITQFVFH
jgi:hypothetical protein